MATRGHALAMAAALWLAAAASPARAADTAGAPPSLCERCATVTSVRSIRRSGEAAALGTLGHRLGAVAAGQAERRAKRYTVWITTVTLKNGRPRSFEAHDNPGLRAGDVVVVEDATLRRYMALPTAR